MFYFNRRMYIFIKKLRLDKRCKIMEYVIHCESICGEKRYFIIQDKFSTLPYIVRSGGVIYKVKKYMKINEKNAKIEDKIMEKVYRSNCFFYDINTLYAEKNLWQEVEW
ncbi:hypothetical protein CFT03427_1451 [Campylobacter fetus subsp. testudinum 03-427]|nr:hypothetical protein CFT03427_1451 [Campylobacter fetus subsp. testudinum 03-427]